MSSTGSYSSGTEGSAPEHTTCGGQGDIFAIISEGVRRFDKGELDAARLAFEAAANVKFACSEHFTANVIKRTTTAIRRLSLIDNYVHSELDEALAEKHPTLKVRRVGEGATTRLLAFDICETNLNRMYYAPHGGLEIKIEHIASPKIDAAPAVDAKETEAELAVAAAKKRWKGRFRARVQAMEALLASAPEDNIPTPSTDGDD